jgi:glutamate synthase domain-containing protein 2
MHRKVQLVASGGISTGGDVATALALGADAAAMARVPRAGMDWIPGVGPR